MKRFTILTLFVLAVSSLGACSALDKVLPDKRTKYRKSEAMPNLEIPPDLTLDVSDDAMIIPGEEATTLSDFREQQALRTAAEAEEGTVGEGWVALSGAQADLWPELRQYWLERGFDLDLDDPELGVLETRWQEREDGERERHKFTVYAEPLPGTSTTQLLVSGRAERWDGSAWQTIGDTDYGLQVTREFRQALADFSTSPTQITPQPDEDS